MQVQNLKQGQSLGYVVISLQIIIFPALLDSIGIDSFYEIFCNFHNKQKCLQTDLTLEIIIFPALLLDSIGIDTFYEIFCNLHNKQKCL